MQALGLSVKAWLPGKHFLYRSVHPAKIDFTHKFWRFTVLKYVNRGLENLQSVLSSFFSWDRLSSDDSQGRSLVLGPTTGRTDELGAVKHFHCFPSSSKDLQCKKNPFACNWMMWVGFNWNQFDDFESIPSHGRKTCVAHCESVAVQFTGNQYWNGKFFVCRHGPLGAASSGFPFLPGC